MPSVSHAGTDDNCRRVGLSAPKTLCYFSVSALKSYNSYAACPSMPSPHTRTDSVDRHGPRTGSGWNVLPQDGARCPPYKQ